MNGEGKLCDKEVDDNINRNSLQLIKRKKSGHKQGEGIQVEMENVRREQENERMRQ